MKTKYFSWRRKLLLRKLPFEVGWLKAFHYNVYKPSINNCTYVYAVCHYCVLLTNVRLYVCVRGVPLLCETQQVNYVFEPFHRIE